MAVLQRTYTVYICQKPPSTRTFQTSILHASGCKSCCAEQTDNCADQVSATDPQLKGLWREFRFAFSEDVNSVDAFMSRLEGMRVEAAEILSNSNLPPVN